MSLTKPEMVLLDIDGTLVDTVPDLAFSIDAMLQTIDITSHGVDISESNPDMVIDSLARLPELI